MNARFSHNNQYLIFKNGYPLVIDIYFSLVFTIAIILFTNPSKNSKMIFTILSNSNCISLHRHYFPHHDPTLTHISNTSNHEINQNIILVSQTSHPLRDAWLVDSGASKHMKKK